MADGTKMADNDAGVVTMPDGRQVAIAILIKDSKMSDADNARLMAEITKIYWAMKESERTPGDDSRKPCAAASAGKI